MWRSCYEFDFDKVFPEEYLPGQITINFDHGHDSSSPKPHNDFCTLDKLYEIKRELLASQE